MLTSPTLLATLAIGLAFYLAWNLGANDVANSMGTAVGSRAISLRQALILAGILEFLGTLLFSQAVTGRIATQVANPSQFSDRPQVLLVGMVAVLFTSGIWLQIATLLKVPVSSSQAVVCAIVGFSDVALGPGAVNWQSLGQISLGWLITPLVSGTLAAGFYGLLHQLLLRPKAPLGQEWSDSEMEKGLSLVQVISCSSVAFAHGANDAGNAVAPLAVILLLLNGGNRYGATLSRGDFIPPLWVIILGGLGIVAGLAVQGKRVISTMGEGLTTLQPSSGLCAELGAAATLLMASRLGFPVSTSHALVGGVVAIGLFPNGPGVRFQALRPILLTWIVTLPATIGLGALSFWLLQQFLL